MPTKKESVKLADLQKRDLEEMIIREVRIRDISYNLQNDFIDAIKNELKRNGISLRDLSKSIDKSAAHVSQVLKKGQNPTIRTIVEIASAVDLKVEFKFSHSSVFRNQCSIMRHVNWVEASKKVEKHHEEASHSPWERIS